MKLNKIIQGDCLDVMKTFPDNSIDTIITDPPYHLTSIVKRFGKKGSAPAKFGTDGAFQRASKGFMGKEWDGGNIAFTTELWKECLRVLKPGGTLLSFGGSRTYHRMACAVEDAGFILKDCIMWLYGSGFPKATDISKQLDKKMGVEHPKNTPISDNGSMSGANYTRNKMEVKSREAKLWNGWKSHGLKPAYEPIIVAMKSNDGTYAANALKHGVAGLNIDGGRIKSNEKLVRPAIQREKKEAMFPLGAGTQIEPQGRFPANILLDSEAAKMLDEQSGESKSGWKDTDKTNKVGSTWDISQGKKYTGSHFGDKGGASRFFYVAKASKSERNMGCEELEEKKIKHGLHSTSFIGEKEYETNTIGKNNHPTVKPLKLMEYLCILTKTPTGGIVLDPFAGSGTTCMACKRTGRPFIGIEQDKEYYKIAEARIKATIVDNKLC